MAKKRRSPKASRRRPSSARRKSKSAARKVRKAPKTLAPEKFVDLKAIRKQFALMASALSVKKSVDPQVQATLDDTRRRVSQWMTDIDEICTPEEEEICGPTMVFPLP